MNTLDEKFHIPAVVNLVQVGVELRRRRVDQGGVVADVPHVAVFIFARWWRYSCEGLDEYHIPHSIMFRWWALKVRDAFLSMLYRKSFPSQALASSFFRVRFNMHKRPCSDCSKMPQVCLLTNEQRVWGLLSQCHVEYSVDNVCRVEEHPPPKRLWEASVLQQTPRDVGQCYPIALG